jgi:hypothetical protein
VPAHRLGRTGGPDLAIDGIPPLALTDLRRASQGTLPALFGTVVR